LNLKIRKRFGVLPLIAIQGTSQLIHLDEGNSMLKIKVFRIGFLLTLFVFCVFSGTVRTQEKKECWNCPSGGQTVSGEFTVPEEWRDPYKPEIESSSVTIEAGGSITLWVDSDRHGSPPYNWGVSGTGYSISPSTTNNPAETITLTCAAGT
jgi:hypothetical protein